MISNVRNAFFAGILMACIPMLSHADDWYGTPWEGIQNNRRCDSSLTEIKKQSKADENVRVEENGSYVSVTDYTPSRNPPTSIYRKEINGRLCLIAFNVGADGMDISWSSKGEIVQIKATTSGTNNDPGDTVIIYKADKNGRLLPSECSTHNRDGSIETFDCLKTYREYEPIRIPPSFDCSILHILNNSERSVCKDGDLAEIDSILAKNYKALRSADIGESREKLIHDQREWVKRRNECQGYKGCILDAYRKRINEVCNNYPAVSGSEPYCNNPYPFASFDCSNPNILGLSERTICRYENLSGYDSTLVRNYKALQAADIGELRNELTRDQDEWLKRRNECKESYDCLLGVYRERVNEVCNKYPIVSGSEPTCKNPDPFSMVYCTSLKKISPTEQTICNDSEISGYDSILANNYSALLANYSSDLHDKLIRDRDEWVKRRNECKGDKDCILSAYRDRIKEICNNYPRVFGSEPSCSYYPQPFASLDCSNPNILNLAEQTICNDSELSNYDSTLAANCKALQAADIGELRDKLTRDQREWIKRRNECNSSKNCILGMYRARIIEICNNYPVVSGSEPSCKDPEPFPKVYCATQKKLSLTEQTICNDNELSIYDLNLADNYIRLRSADIGNWRDITDKLIRDQREWVKRRNECKDNKDCILDAYRKRNNEICNNYPVVSGSKPFCKEP
jgi:uncharacterized protein